LCLVAEEDNGVPDKDPEAMSRTRMLLQGAALSGGSVFFSMLTLLVVAKIFTNRLDPSEVAVFALLLLSADFLNLAGTFGLSVSLPKIVGAAPPYRQDALVRANLSAQIVVSLTLGVAIWAAWAWLPRPENWPENPDWRRLIDYAWLLPPLFIAGALRDMAMAALAGLNAYGRRAAGIAAASLAQMILVFVLIGWWRGGIVTLSLATALSYAVGVAWFFASLPAGRGFRLDWRAYASSIRFSIPLYLNNLLTFFYQRFDTVLLLALLDAPSAAIFEMAKRIPMILARVLNALLVPFLPNLAALIAAEDFPRAARLLNRAVALTAFTGYSAALAVIAVQEPLLILLFNADYLPAAPVLGALMAAICITVQTGLMGQSLIALGKPHLITAINTGLAALSVALNLLLIPRFGLMGAGAAAVGAILFGFLCQAACVHRNRLPLDVRACLMPQLAFAAALLPAYWTGSGFLLRCAALITFVLLCLAFRVVDKALLLEIRTALRRNF
jgi:O-antigen/teichoic acid export membrane protein